MNFFIRLILRGGPPVSCALLEIDRGGIDYYIYFTYSFIELSELRRDRFFFLFSQKTTWLLYSEKCGIFFDFRCSVSNISLVAFVTGFFPIDFRILKIYFSQ